MALSRLKGSTTGMVLPKLPASSSHIPLAGLALRAVSACLGLFLCCSKQKTQSLALREGHRVAGRSLKGWVQLRGPSVVVTAWSERESWINFPRNCSEEFEKA